MNSLMHQITATNVSENTICHQAYLDQKENRKWFESEEPR